MELPRGGPGMSWQRPCQGRGTGSRSRHARARWSSPENSKSSWVQRWFPDRSLDGLNWAKPNQGSLQKQPVRKDNDVNSGLDKNVNSGLNLGCMGKILEPCR
ncbi:hypothetical protein SLEP1_g5927 [Rubroshorea leprosula]|uniref:Uncharacterized protein n=1 Tax=Rubroshorea leprosula TaxID=152421 RepID=A0AAV5I1M4_9ROSI|nr:hypothetical protein SLEP1_g5927 [Rubroshorea leprosula]